MATHGYNFTFQTENGLARISGDGFDTRDEADAAFKRALDTFGYKPPRWWQFWRWGETLPSPYRKAPQTPEAPAPPRKRKDTTK